MLVVGLNRDEALRHMRELAHHLSAFPKNFDKALVDCLNEAAKRGRKRSGDVLSKRYRAPRSKILSRITIRKARTPEDAAGVRGRGRPMTIGSYKMQAFPVTDSRGVRHQGLKAAVLKAERPRVIRGAFVAKGMGFRRRGDGAYPLDAVYGPTAVGFLADEERMRPVGEETLADFEAALHGAAMKQLRKLGLA